MHQKDPNVPALRCSGALVTRLTRQAWRAGVSISTGTDGTADSQTVWPEMFEEILFLAHDVGMPSLQVLRSATLIGARACGQARDMGSLEPGKLANFVVLRADPIADIRNVRSVEPVVKQGQAFLRSDYRPGTKAEINDAGFPVSGETVWKVP
jgi:imidazolonepropionase-like amidohydrolase